MQDTKSDTKGFQDQNHNRPSIYIPNKAGKTCPITWRKSGSKVIGNMIPESIIEGKKISCAIMVSFA